MNFTKQMKALRNPLNAHELSTAFSLWHFGYEQRGLDEDLAPFLDKRIVPTQATLVSDDNPGWLRRMRNGLQLSCESVANRMNISRAAYSQLERNESRQSITLSMLSKAAEAMDCELVYAIRPKSKALPSTQIWTKLVSKASRHGWLNACDQRRRGNAVAGLAKRLLIDSEFRRQQGWSRI